MAKNFDTGSLVFTNKREKYVFSSRRENACVFYITKGEPLIVVKMLEDGSEDWLEVLSSKGFAFIKTLDVSFDEEGET